MKTNEKIQSPALSSSGEYGNDNPVFLWRRLARRLAFSAGLVLAVLLFSQLAQAQVQWRRVTEQVAIQAGWQTIRDASRPRGYRRVEREARNGLRAITYRVLYDRGRATGRRQRVSERVVRRAVMGRIRIGTGLSPGPTPTPRPTPQLRPTPIARPTPTPRPTPTIPPRPDNLTQAQIDWMLLDAAGNNDNQRALRAIRWGADVNVVGEYNLTPLYHAASQDNTELVDWLLMRLATVNGASSHTPLHAAGSPRVARLLLDSNAEVNARNDNGDTPLHSLANKYLDGAHVTTEFARQVMVPHALLLLQRGADANALNNSGESPLHLAVFRNNRPLARLLLDANADVNAQTNNYQTPLSYARRGQGDTTDIIALLQARGAIE